MATQNGQTCLENNGIEERSIEIVKNEYNENNEYGLGHENAIANGDKKGKGNGSNGHTHYLPDCSKPKTMMDYSNFDTYSEAGSSFDINGRNDIGGRKKNIMMSKYNKENQYGAHLINTSNNKGQVRL